MNQTLDIMKGSWHEKPSVAPGGIILAILLSTLFWAACYKLAVAG